MTATGGLEGTLLIKVWPVYVGLSVRHPGETLQAEGEPTWSPDYARGQIHWATENNQVVGRSTIRVPAMEFEYLIYLYGPGDMPLLMGYRLIEQLLIIPQPGIINVYPICEDDWIQTPRAQRNGAQILP